MIAAYRILKSLAVVVSLHPVLRLVAGCFVVAVLTSPVLAAAPGDGAVIRAEVQVGICAPPADVERSLQLRPVGNVTEIWLFDDDGLTLHGRGARLRLRAAEKGAELTLKVSDQDCERVDARMLPPGSGKCEIDIHGDHAKGAVSLSRRLTSQQAKDLASGRVAPTDLLDSVQSRYLREVVGLWPLPANLRPLGPIQSRSYVTPGVRYDVDVSRLPASDVYVEISRKVPAAEAWRTKDALEAMLKRAGVAACADQSGQAGRKLQSLLR